MQILPFTPSPNLLPPLMATEIYECHDAVEAWHLGLLLEGKIVGLSSGLGVCLGNCQAAWGEDKKQKTLPGNSLALKHEDLDVSPNSMRRCRVPLDSMRSTKSRIGGLSPHSRGRLRTPAKTSRFSDLKGEQPFYLL